MAETTLPETGTLLSWSTASMGPVGFAAPYTFGYADLTPTVRLFGQLELAPDDPPLVPEEDVAALAAAIYAMIGPHHVLHIAHTGRGWASGARAAIQSRRSGLISCNGRNSLVGSHQRAASFSNFAISSGSTLTLCVASVIESAVLGCRDAIRGIDAQGRR